MLEHGLNFLLEHDCAHHYPLPPSLRNKEQRHSKKTYWNKRNNNQSVKRSGLVPGLRTDIESQMKHLRGERNHIPIDCC